MAANVTRWAQNPAYLAATTTYIPPGGRTAYAVPHPAGQSPSDVTSFHYGQRHWTEHNLPSIIYALHATDGWKEFENSQPPRQKIDIFGYPMVEQYPEASKPARPILDYAILPDKIGTQEHWWYFEAIRRLDPRVTWEDICMRMELPRANGNSLNQTSVRMRVRFCMLSWFAKTSPNKPNARRDQVLAMLTPNQINSGTTRGSTPGLINPGLGEAGGRILLPEVREGSGTYQPTRRPKAHSQSHTQSVAGFEGSNQQGSYGGLPSQSSTPLPSQWSVLEGAGNSRRHEEYYDSRDNPFNDYPSRLSHSYAQGAAPSTLANGRNLREPQAMPSSYPRSQPFSAPSTGTENPYIQRPDEVLQYPAADRRADMQTRKRLRMVEGNDGDLESPNSPKRIRTSIEQSSTNILPLQCAYGVSSSSEKEAGHSQNAYVAARAPQALQSMRKRAPQLGRSHMLKSTSDKRARAQDTAVRDHYSLERQAMSDRGPWQAVDQSSVPQGSRSQMLGAKELVLIESDVRQRPLMQDASVPDGSPSVHNDGSRVRPRPITPQNQRSRSQARQKRTFEPDHLNLVEQKSAKKVRIENVSPQNTLSPRLQVPSRRMPRQPMLQTLAQSRASRASLLSHDSHREPPRRGPSEQRENAQASQSVRMLSRQAGKSTENVRVLPSQRSSNVPQVEHWENDPRMRQPVYNHGDMQRSPRPTAEVVHPGPHHLELIDQSGFRTLAAPTPLTAQLPFAGENQLSHVSADSIIPSNAYLAGQHGQPQESSNSRRNDHKSHAINADIDLYDLSLPTHMDAVSCLWQDNPEALNFGPSRLGTGSREDSLGADLLNESQIYDDCEDTTSDTDYNRRNNFTGNESLNLLESHGVHPQAISFQETIAVGGDLPAEHEIINLISPSASPGPVQWTGNPVMTTNTRINNELGISSIAVNSATANGLIHQQNSRSVSRNISFAAGPNDSSQAGQESANRDLPSTTGSQVAQTDELREWMSSVDELFPHFEQADYHLWNGDMSLFDTDCTFEDLLLSAPLPANYPPYESTLANMGGPGNNPDHLVSSVDGDGSVDSRIQENGVVNERRSQANSPLESNNGDLLPADKDDENTGLLTGGNFVSDVGDDLSWPGPRSTGMQHLDYQQLDSEVTTFAPTHGEYVEPLFVPFAPQASNGTPAADETPSEIFDQYFNFEHYQAGSVAADITSPTAIHGLNVDFNISAGTNLPLANLPAVDTTDVTTRDLPSAEDLSDFDAWLVGSQRGEALPDLWTPR